MNFRKLNEGALADFSRNVATLLGGTELASIDSNVRADLATAIGTMPDTLATEAAEVMTAEGARKSAVSARNGTKKSIIDLMSQVRNALKAGLAPKEQYDLCNFDFPPLPAGSYIPQNPTNLSVTGFSNGVIRGGFSGNNGRSSVHYEIWRRQGDSGPWAIHITTKKQNFEDSPVTPGQFYEYKVRAVAARAVSNFCDSAVVYGTV